MTNGYLITKRGRMVHCSTMQHAQQCVRYFGITLLHFLSHGGCRVLFYRNTFAIEHGQPLSRSQRARIEALLKEDDYYTVIDNDNTEMAFDRPIRRIKDEKALSHTH